MDGAIGNANWITAARPEAELDDLQLIREAGVLLSRELSGAVAALHAADANAARRAVAADRLDAVRELHALLLPTYGRMAIDEAVTGLILAVARFGSGDAIPVTIVSDTVVVDAPGARAVLLALSALLRGEAAGVAAADDRIEIEVRVADFGAEIVVHDFGDGAPDRPRLGGRTLRRVLRATDGYCSTSASPGLSTTRVTLPLVLEADSMRTVGHA